MRTTILFVLSVMSSVYATSSDVAPQNIDELFAAYNNPHSPGCSVGVVRGGNFVFRKSYGRASLELNVPLTPESIFYMASVSKQFTAASAVLAAEQGYLSLDDDVRKYVPELPDYGRAVTLRQMLHQTSGFRDFLALTYLSGRDVSALSSPHRVLELITRQKELNNVPGEEFVYSNSNYFLLGVVVKRATGKSLAEFARANIFQPLGMTHTFFYDDNKIVVPDRVAAYDPGKDGRFLVNWSTLFDIVGGGGLMSNVNDLMLWDRIFYSNGLGKGTLVRELEAHGILNNGRQINYGLGLWQGEYRGLRTVEHSGGTFGYRTELLRFPEQRFSVIVLCNIASADVEGLGRKISDLYLEKQLKSEANEMVRPGVLPDPASFAGTYLDPRTHMTYTFTAVNGNLVAWGAKLRRLGANQFSDIVGNPITFESAHGAITATLTLQGETYFSGNKVPDIHLSESALSGFAGDYRSDELDATYNFSLVKGTLLLKIGDESPVDLNPVAPDKFQAGDLGTVIFRRTGNNRVSGEFLSATRFVDKLNWAEGVDTNGRPIRTDVKPTPAGTKVCPGYSGATNWFAPSYNKSTQLFYFLALEQCQTYFSAPQPEQFTFGKEFYSTGVKHIRGENSQKLLLAFKPASGTFAWKYPQVGGAHSTGGTMSTAGGLLFFGDDAQSFEAVDAQNGKPLWHFNTGQDMSASPMTYAIDGRQYVAIAVGSDIFTFALPH